MTEEPEMVPQEPAEVVAMPDPSAEPAVESLAGLAADIERLDVDAPQVALIVPDRSDMPVIEAVEHELDRRQIRSETRVMSADEEPQAVADYTENARMRGIRVIVAGTGPAARLAGLVTLHTRLPVIGVPLSSQDVRADRLAALLAERVGEGEEPIAWVGLDDGLAAAALVVRILGA